MRQGDAKYLDDAESSLERAARLLERSSDRSLRMMISGNLALVQLRRGALAAAEALAGQGWRSWSSRFHPGFTCSKRYAAVVEVYLARWKRRSEMLPRERRECSKQLRRALRVLGQYALMFAIGRPRTWHLLGRYAAHTRLPGLADRAWLRGLRAADRLGMPYEVARACYELAVMPRAHAVRSTSVGRSTSLADWARTPKRRTPVRQTGAESYFPVVGGVMEWSASDGQAWPGVTVGDSIPPS